MKSIELFSNILLSDFLRYFIAAGSAYLIFWIFFKRQWHHRIIQKKELKAKKIWFEFRYSMCTVVIFAIIGWGIVTAKNIGYTLIYNEIEEFGWGWFLISIILMILLHDTWFYWTHRLMHHPFIFRHVHLVHHRSTNPSPWAAYSFHPIEAVVEAGIFPIIVFTIPAHGIALLIFLIYMITQNVQGHLGIEFLPKWFIKNKWISWHTTTTHHDLHHKDFNSNYGLYFTWWDKWLGTEHENYLERFKEVTSRNQKKVHLVEKQESSNIPGPKNKNGSFKIPFFLIVFLIAFIGEVQTQSVAGLWQTYHEGTGDSLSLIRIENIHNSIQGKVAKIFLQPWEGEDPICSKCTDSRKNKKVKGMEILWGFKKDGQKWSGGKILDPASGKVYNSNLWLEDAQTLKVRGYAGAMNLIYRTQTWKLQQAKDDSNPIIGLWKTIDDESGNPKSLIEISENNGQLSGRILKIYLQPWEGENPICLQCPGTKKKAKIIGMTILWNFKKDTDKPGDSHWTSGNILDPGNGKTYTSSVWLEDENTLKVRGYWGLFYRTQTWKRIE